MNTIYMKSNGLKDKSIDLFGKLGVTVGSTTLCSIKDDLTTIAKTMFQRYARIGGMVIYFDNLNIRDSTGKMKNMTQPIVRKWQN
jgi:hypothetical protein